MCLDNNIGKVENKSGKLARLQMPKKLLATVAIISEAGAILKKDKLSALNGLWTPMGLFFLNFLLPHDYFFPCEK